MKFKLILLAGFIGALFISAIPSTSQNTPAADITLNGGGKRGEVHFPHQKHIDTLGDCNVCHDLYPNTAGIIDALKAQGKLREKQVMNEQCIQCHRTAKKEGKSSGPTTCSKCHSG